LGERRWVGGREVVAVRRMAWIVWRATILRKEKSKGERVRREKTKNCGVGDGY